MINERLVKKLGLSPERRAAIIDLHEQRKGIFETMSRLNPSKTRAREVLRSYVPLIESIEFKLQEEWGFDRDRSKHTWWFRAPHCQCPYYDNQDIVYAGQRIINASCPLHGDA